MPVAIKPSSEDATDESQPNKKHPVAAKVIHRSAEENHGRYGAKDYTGCPIVSITHTNLKAGDSCPQCVEANQHGKLYNIKPGIIICLESLPLVSGKRYELEKLRCSLCGKQYTADIPKECLSTKRFAKSCGTSIAMMHYYFGLPFHRIERLQELQGIPLPDSTQWDLVSQLYTIIDPVYEVIESIAAEGHLFHYDDTPSRILYCGITARSVHTTAVISQVGSYTVQLFYTGPKVASEHFEKLLKQRESFQPFFTMTDASFQNIPRDVKPEIWISMIMCFCLVHGRRKFYEIREFFKVHCDFVMDQIAKVYRHEAFCKEHGLNEQERLAYHRARSGPVMDALWIWLKNQLFYRSVEPNSGLGVAIRYALRHWLRLTRFLQCAGAPIDNSWAERMIKIVIRYRRTALFYKTRRGAEIGDCFMSVIQTAIHNGINPFEYLTVLQEQAKWVVKEPQMWLPWNYKTTLSSQVMAA